jgi:hypothetical protein
MQQETKNVVFTDHALERAKLRKVTQAMMVSAITQPDRKQPEADGDTKFIKDIQKRNVQVVATYLNDEKKWLVKSVWVRGEDDPEPAGKVALPKLPWGRMLKMALGLIGWILGLMRSHSSNRSRNNKR